MKTSTPVVVRALDERAISNPESASDRQRRRDATEASVRGMLPALGLDELRVIERQIEKMLRARDKYGGELNLDSDRRDFLAEAAEEHRDAVFYLLVDELVRNDQRLERLHCAAADEMARTNPVEHALREFTANAPDYPSAHELGEGEG